jgi:membrane-associated phospholipid phosphatase
MRHYTFVDYATQVYCALVALLILCFHNATVRAWPWLVAANVTTLLLVHALIHWHARRFAGGSGLQTASSPEASPASVSSPPLEARRLRRPEVRAPLDKGLDFLRYFYPVLLYTGFFCETGLINRMFIREYLDPVVIGWDQKLFGCQPSVLFMQQFPYPALSELLYAAYFSYYLMVVGVGIALFLRHRQQFFHYVSVVSFVFYLCYLAYIVLPVIGPMVFFHEVDGYSLPASIQQLAPTDVYPDTIKAGLMYRLMAWIYRVFEAPGSALPSSHVAVAICTLYFSCRYLRRIRYLHLVAVVLLCLATVYGHYHYVSDVLSGLLTAGILIPLANWLYFRRAPRLSEPGGTHPQTSAPAQSRRLARI